MGSMITSDGDRLQSVERAMSVLLAFDAQRPSATMAELAEATKLARPTVRRILLTLHGLGYVENSGSHWRLTPRVLSIGQHYSASNSIIEVAQPHLQRLAERTGESASLAALDGTDAVYIGRVSIRRIMTINVSIGTRVPAHATSMGRVLLAWAAPELIAQVIDETGLPAHTRWTVTDASIFRGALRTVKDQGWSLVSEELEAGLISVAAPVRDQNGTVIAALASSTSTGRSSGEKLVADTVPLLVATAEKISDDLGHHVPAASRSLRANAHEGFF